MSRVRCRGLRVEDRKSRVIPFCNDMNHQDTIKQTSIRVAQIYDGNSL